MSGFLWGALPYIAFTVMVVGTAYRYWTGERGWSTKSSEFLAKDSLKVAGPMFHLGLLMAFGGHVIGILVPKALTDGVGISEHLYHIIALSGGIPAGILFFGGFILLMQRRFCNPRMKVNTSTSDVVIYLILFLTRGRIVGRLQLSRSNIAVVPLDFGDESGRDVNGGRADNFQTSHDNVDVDSDSVPVHAARSLPEFSV